MKWIEANPGVRYIRLRRRGKRGTRVLFGTAVDPCFQGNVTNGASGSAPAPVGSQKTGGLLLQEMEETNNWARLALQLYFGWFALQFTVNGVAMGWLFTYHGPMPWFASLIILVFVGWNVIGAIGTVLVYKGLANCDARIDELIETLAKHISAEDYWSKPRSPIPRSMLNAVFTFCAITMFVSLGFWLILFIGGR
jgi:hypothetical protein